MFKCEIQPRESELFRGLSISVPEQFGSCLIDTLDSFFTVPQQTEFITFLGLARNKSELFGNRCRKASE